MRTISLKLAAVFVSTGLLGLIGGTLVGVAQMPTPQPKGEPPAKADAPPASPASDRPSFDADLPATLRDKVWESEIQRGLFPDIKAPAEKKGEAIRERLTKAYPYLFGSKGLAAEPIDTPHRKLLKATLAQYARFFFRIFQPIDRGGQSPLPQVDTSRCLDEIRRLATELWSNEPKTLIPWLEETLMLAKDIERITEVRVKIGQDFPMVLDLATADRLRAEDALWKAKNPKPVGR